MNFECLLLSAKAGNEDAITTILQMYRPLLLKYAIIDGVLDEDLYQELSIILLKAIKFIIAFLRGKKLTPKRKGLSGVNIIIRPQKRK